VKVYKLVDITKSLVNSPVKKQRPYQVPSTARVSNSVASSSSKTQNIEILKVYSHKTTPKQGFIQKKCLRHREIELI
jgi:hypothetical protein